MISYISSSQVNRLSAKEIASSAVSLARLDMYDRGLLEALGSAAVRQITEFGGQELSNLAWGFAKLMHRDDRLMEAIATRFLAATDGSSRSPPSARAPSSLSEAASRDRLRPDVHGRQQQQSNLLVANAQEVGSLCLASSL